MSSAGNGIKRMWAELKMKILKDVFDPACLACAVSWLAFVVAIFIGHESGDNKGQPSDDWMNRSFNLSFKEELRCENTVL